MGQNDTIIDIAWEDPECDLIAAVRQIQEVLDFFIEAQKE
jgi:hypothetical protein